MVLISCQHIEKENHLILLIYLKLCLCVKPIGNLLPALFMHYIPKLYCASLCNIWITSVSLYMIKLWLCVNPIGKCKLINSQDQILPILKGIRTLFFNCMGHNLFVS